MSRIKDITDFAKDTKKTLCIHCKKRPMTPNSEYCKTCYPHHVYWKNNPEKYKKYMKLKQEKINKKYKEDANYAERTRKKQHSYYHRRLAKNPDWNAEKQREYRKNNPDTFNRCMARFYLRKMETKEIRKLTRQIYKERREVL